MTEVRSLIDVTVSSKTIDDINALINIDPTDRIGTTQAVIESAVKYDRTDIVEHYFDQSEPYATQELTHIMIKACEHSAIKVIGFCVEDVKLNLTNTRRCLGTLLESNNSACIDLFLSHHHEVISSDSRLLDFHIKGKIGEIAHHLIPYIEHRIEHKGIIKSIVTSSYIEEVSYAELSRVLGDKNAQRALFLSQVEVRFDMDANRNTGSLVRCDQNN